MEITKVRVKLNTLRKRKDKVLGTASVVFDDVFVVHDINIIQGECINYIQMPSRKTVHGDTDVANPITKEFREELQNKIMDEYKRMLNEKC